MEVADRGGDGGGRDEDRRRKKPMPPRDFRAFNHKGQLSDDEDYYVVESASFRYTFFG